MKVEKLDKNNIMILQYKSFYQSQLGDLCQAMMTLNEIKKQINKENKDHLTKRIENSIKKILENMKPEQIQTRNKIEVEISINNKIKKVLLPRNFSWVIFGKLIGTSIPIEKDQIIAMQEMNVRLIVTAMENGLDKQLLENSQIVNLHIETINYKAPTIGQIEKYMQVSEEEIEKGNVVAVHCGGGKGRAGTFLTCFIIKNGVDGTINKDQFTRFKMDAQEAIKFIRYLRPGSIETLEQEQFIVSYYQHLLCQSNNNNNINNVINNNEKQLQTQEEIEELVELSQEQKKRIKNCANLIILVGIPGSGKTTLSKLLMTVNKQDKKEHFIRASLDEDKKELFEQKLINFSKNNNNQHLIIDRTNLKKEDRIRLLELTNTKNTLCIVLETGVQQCVNRIQKRVNHPTFDCNKYSYDQLFKSLKDRQNLMIEQFPNEMKTVIIKNDDELIECLVQLGANKEIIEQYYSRLTGKWYFYKFPRTKHLWNTGAMTEDDEVSNENQCTKYYGNNSEVVLVQEKVDGANLGISINDDDVIVFQNRGKLVHSETESQFKKLKQFQQKFAQDLYQLLEKRYILFGEWCTLKHSIYYDKLPSEFLVFDIFDKYVNKFLSFQKICSILESYQFDMVPLIVQQKFKNKQDLEKLLESESKFRDGKVEGVYLRIDQGDYCIDRCKLVRSDFIQGITQHWKTMEKVENLFLKKY